MNSKRSWALLGVAAAAVLQAASYSPAATITWTTAPVSGPTDVSTTGTFVSALDENNSQNPIVVNTVPFATGEFTSPSGNDAGYFSLDGTSTAPIVVSGTFDGSGTEYYHTGGSPTSDSNYNALLGYLGFENQNAYLTVTANSLTPGHTYQIQMFVYQIFGGTNGAAIVSGPTLSSSGDVGTGTFTADQTSQSFSFTGPQSGAAGIFDAFQLRDLTVPEPASAGIALAAAMGISLSRRRRHLA